MGALLPKFLCALLVASAFAVGSACSSSSDSNGGASDAGPQSDVYVTCKNDPRVQEYVAGVTPKRPASTFQAQIASIDPTPPAVGTNTWTVHVTDANGAPIPGPTGGKQPGEKPPVDMQLYMPDHGHSSTYADWSYAGDGKWQFSGIYFFMPGVWRITLLVTRPGDTPDAGPKTDSAEYFFCIDG